MADLSYNNIHGVSDAELLRSLGSFIKHHRVQQNKSQVQLAKEAGIARSTLSLFEKGENTSMLVFIQLLRTLRLLYLLSHFEIVQELSPLQLAKIEQSKRIRAGRKNPVKGDGEPKADW